jgi:hypothetical protein
MDWSFLRMAFRNPGKIIRYEGEEGTDVEGFWIEVRQVRTGDAFAALTKNTYWIDLHEAMAPYVVSWNFEGEIVDEVEKPAIGDVVPARTTYAVRYEPLPPPAEAGGEIFNKVATEVKQWILLKLQGSLFHRDEDPGKDESSSEPMPDGEQSEMPEATSKPRRSRKSSPVPLPAT